MRHRRQICRMSHPSWQTCTTDGRAARMKWNERGFCDAMRWNDTSCLLSRRRLMPDRSTIHARSSPSSWLELGPWWCNLSRFHPFTYCDNHACPRFQTSRPQSSSYPSVLFVNLVSSARWNPSSAFPTLEAKLCSALFPPVTQRSLVLG
jgi:hypothetical protein